MSPIFFEQAVEAATVQLEAACIIRQQTGDVKKVPLSSFRKSLEELMEFLRGQKEVQDICFCISSSLFAG